jgi:hypothetical protein
MNGGDMNEHAITIRHSHQADRAALARLAALDDRPGAVENDALLGFVDGELRAALALSGGEAIADPFAHTSELVELLELRAAQEPAREARRRAIPLRRLGLRWAA